MSTKIGDVFEITVEPGKFCYGQVLSKKKPIFYMALFEGAYAQTPDLDELLRKPLWFLGNFFDIKLKNGDWKLVGNRKPDLSHVPFPCYKVKYGDDFVVERWDGLQRRKATPEEILQLDFPTNCSAMLLENAAKAMCGLQPWESMYEKFRPDYIATRSVLV